MKKNSKLIIAVIIVIALLAVAAWYFFFRTPAQRIVEEEIAEDEQIPGPLDQYVCPPGTSGAYPDCKLDVINQDTIFANAIEAAKKSVTNNLTLNAIQRSNVISVIDVYVTKNKDVIVAEASTGKDIVQLILADAQKIYLSTYGTPVTLTLAALASRGKG